ncbi:MAG: flagellar hook-associated protein FlgK, partial [Bryobacterales bacterium]|nr:flagellar hook-associated protein FlgK [Bryobacterales bacterium]
LARQIQGYNVDRQNSGQNDAGLDAKVSSALENLSQIANISTSTAPDGTTTVLLGGQTPLVIGAQSFSIQTGYAPAGTTLPANPNGLPAFQIEDQAGNDITTQITEGKLAGLLQVRNSTLPSIQGDRSQQGSLNQVAQAFADRVNSLLTSGQITTGPPPQAGIPLFTYNPGDPTNIAKSLTVNSAISAGQIAVIDPGPPASSNGIANQLTQIAQGTNAQDQINGLSFTAFVGQIASTVGGQLATATSNQDLQQQSVAQAKSLQSQLSGVSLDAEAVKLLQYQRAYDATAKLISILDQVTQSTLAILP